MTAANARIGYKIIQLVFESGRRRFGDNGGEAAGKTAVVGEVDRFVDRKRLNGIDGDLDGERARYRVDHFRGVHKQETLVFHFALDVHLAVRRADHPRSQRQSRLELLLYEWQGSELRGRELLRRGRTLLR